MRVVELSGGVGGARMAAGLATLQDVELTIVVNVGDDEVVHGLHVSPDIDTVTYTLAGVEGPEGWGRRGDSFNVNEELARFGVDNTFRLGDLDLALNIYRSVRLQTGDSLSAVTRWVAESFEISASILPVTDDLLRTELLVEGDWISFQDYFVLRRHSDTVDDIRFAEADRATPAPGVIEAIGTADKVIIAPSNPPLSIWPIFAVPGIRQALQAHPEVTAVSPLIGGKALKGPADQVMAALGLPPGNRGVVEAYAGLIRRLVIDIADASDRDSLRLPDVMVTDTRIREPAAAKRLAQEILGS